MSSCVFYQNELILVAVSECLCDTIFTLLHGQFDKHMIMENLELLLLAIDEMV